MSKPADGTASGRWSEFAELSLFARVARRCCEAYEAGEVVSVRRELLRLAAGGVTAERTDLEPRAVLEAANAARQSGTDPDGIGTALRAGKLRRRHRVYNTTTYGPLRDAFYRVVENLRTEPLDARNGSNCYHGRCLTTLAVQLDTPLPPNPSTEQIAAWVNDGRAAKRAEAILEFMLGRLDSPAE